MLTTTACTSLSFYFSRLVLALLVSIGLLLACSASYAQTPSWQTVAIATPTSNTAFSQVNATAVDANGNVYIIGEFEGSVRFGTTTLTSAGNYDVFIAKWHPTTGFMWAQRVGGSGYEFGTAIALNGSSVYVTGTFQSATISLGATTLANAGPGYFDGFVAKLTDGGNTSNFNWAQQVGNAVYDEMKAIAVDGANVYVAGQFSSTLRLGSTTLTTAGLEDLFIAKLVDQGNTASFVWAQRAGGSYPELAQALTVVGSNVYLAGSFSSPTADFGSSRLTTAGGEDVFVCKLQDLGASARFSWAQGAGGNGIDRANAVAVNGNNVYLTGEFGTNDPSAHFGDTTLTSRGYDDVFISKLTDAGTNAQFIWTQQVGNINSDLAHGLAVQGNKVYVTGRFASPVLTVGTTALNNSASGSYEIFVMQLTDVGSASRFEWAQRAGGTRQDQASSVTLSGTRLYVAGYVQPPAQFGSHTVSSTSAFGAAFLAILDNLPLPTNKPVYLAEVGLYPNPAYTSVTVQFPASTGTTQATFTFSDLMGRVVRTQSLRLTPMNATAEVSVAGLTPGMYRVQVKAGNQYATSLLAIK
ncbi:T9SS type A sorting domain-containing protein [uncultured Hymenobacter sp.]|uniref:T9SS type A sorting domain-containing protein n=1 Tax=uncultured Hymenobacter sp. TaxID=170016 RepID=UPI0035C98AC0